MNQRSNPCILVAVLASTMGKVKCARCGRNGLKKCAVCHFDNPDKRFTANKEGEDQDASAAGSKALVLWEPPQPRSPRFEEPAAAQPLGGPPPAIDPDSCEASFKMHHYRYKAYAAPEIEKLKAQVQAETDRRELAETERDQCKDWFWKIREEKIAGDKKYEHDLGKAEGEIAGLKLFLARYQELEHNRLNRNAQNSQKPGDDRAAQRDHGNDRRSAPGQPARERSRSRH